MATFIDTLKRNFSAATTPVRLIYINVAMFVAVRLAAIVCMLFNVDIMPAICYLEFPSDLSLLLKQPWTIITYQFLHYDLMHILFNMLWLYWLGTMFYQIFGTRRLIGLYFLGGFGGALIYLAAYNLLPVFAGSMGFLLGASASILAIVTAMAVCRPDFKVGMLFLGSISLKWIAIITIFIDFISIGADNTGGHIAHIGGAAIGALFGIADRRGIDITAFFNNFIDAVVNLFRRGKSSGSGKFRFKKWRKSKQSSLGEQKNDNRMHNTTMTPANEAELDKILAKIKQSGYKSLSVEEKKRLFDVSNTRKQ